MSLVKYRRFPSLRDIQEEINRLFSGRISSVTDDHSVIDTSEWSPHADVMEKENEYLILADIPGVDPKDIKVKMSDGVLTIEGERKSEKKEERDNYSRYERCYGSFARRFTLPDNTNAEKISAKGKNGVLEITIPKSEKRHTTEIIVEVQK